MTTLSEPQAKQRAESDTRLRVVLMLEIQDGAQQRFLDVYEKLRHQVASVPGHVSDQLCQSINDPRQWLITSEWEDQETFLEWVDSPAHREMVKPMHGCVSDTFRSLRYSILRETSAAGATGTRAPVEVPPGSAPARPAAAQVGPPQVKPGPDGVTRHALTFTVKPGSEPEVARILAGYASPKAEVDSVTRLQRTSLFMHGNRVVRAVEVVGNLGDALRHVAMQPEVRAVEEAINPHLEEARQLGDPEAARAFFARAALPAEHQAIASAPAGKLHRHAVLYPVRPGKGKAVTALLAAHDELASADPTGPIATSAVFHRDDVVFRLVDLRVPAEAVPAEALGVAGEREAAALGRLLDLGPEGDLRTVAGLSAFLANRTMNPVTDRSSAPADAASGRRRPAGN